MQGTPGLRHFDSFTRLTTAITPSSVRVCVHFTDGKNILYHLISLIHKYHSHSLPTNAFLIGKRLGTCHPVRTNALGSRITAISHTPVLKTLTLTLRRY